MSKDLEKSPGASAPTRGVEVAVCAILGPTLGPTHNILRNHVKEPHILITKRLANTVYPGFWELPGGKLEPNETPADAAVREAREELGVAIAVEAVLAPIEHTYEHARVCLHTCVARLLPDSPDPHDLQVQAHAWRALDDLPWDTFLPANARVIAALRRYLEALGGGSGRGSAAG